jgi:hypothetical protein
MYRQSHMKQRQIWNDVLRESVKVQCINRKNVRTANISKEHIHAVRERERGGGERGATAMLDIETTHQTQATHTEQ